MTDSQKEEEENQTGSVSPKVTPHNFCIRAPETLQDRKKIARKSEIQKKKEREEKVKQGKERESQILK